MSFEELWNPIPPRAVQHGSTTVLGGVKLSAERLCFRGVIGIVGTEAGRFVVFLSSRIEVLNVPEWRAVLAVEIGHTSLFF